ncbi:hypothetical protein [Zavarzinia compransoris]|uniref:Lipoprotein n=1 Tax=Zavarzinia compransoris TaxID=1264899 RepID=A0A317DWP1_9PROT|nr:hypothetical protein [Zavarzinia compransoris]PWR18951.1 hypothetical protein DKG75_18450 [Zavarzinia compransoris]TDP48951.1 hypothetical protein DES42_101311 [Zavarzinia compransoris]
MTGRLFLLWMLAVTAGLGACATPPAETAAAVPVPEAQDPRTALIASVPNGSLIFRLKGEHDIQHVQSGMACPLARMAEADRLIRLFVFPNPRDGDDVACDYAFFGGKLTAYATRNTGLTAEAVVGATADFIRGAHPEATPAALDLPAADGLPKITGAVFNIVLDGKPARTKVLVAIKDGWVIKVRATYPTDPAAPAEPLLADLGASLWILPVLQSMPPSARTVLLTD